MNNILKSMGLFLITLTLVSCSKPTLHIKGKITNIKEANLYFWILEEGEFVQKEVIKVKEGEFTFSYEIGDAKVGYITNLENTEYGQVIFLENKKITLEGLIFKGMPLIKKLSGESLNSKFFAYKNEKTEIFRNGKNELAYKKVSELRTKFITDNASNILGLYELFEWSKNPNNYKEAIELYAKLPKAAKDYQLYTHIGHNLETIKSIAPGNRAIDFNFTTLEGNAISLDYFKGKVLMIDFWASWCGPCRKELPHIKKLYERFKPLGLEVLAVSLDSKRERWLAAVENHELNWHNYSALNKWDCEFTKKYKVRGIPYNVIIDKKGNIVAKGIHGKELEKTIEGLLK
ncbi:redoxin domain-containing protein [Carboxylicivirga sp. N1Y90]|uniref:redoxin domain-containing protein n=1 Tax=Carboxylicivirga fragile TaxID=3417571 RepID=UPI003D343685|nr:AhpC/TSA family protein [Marinilabiliaceae bacterium N1Y90]